MKILEDIKEQIEKASSIVILCHENPDGDAIGSSLALYHVLKQIGKKDVDVIIPKYAKNFECLQGIEILKFESDKKYDLAITVDCAQEKLLSYWIKYFNEAKVKIVIDHHNTNSNYGDYNYIEANAPACTQVLFNVFKYLNIKFDEKIAEGLLCGIITDTGGFQYEKVSDKTFDITSELLKTGIKYTQLYKNVFSTRTKANLEIRKIALNRLEFLEQGKITYTYILKEDFEKAKAEEGDHEGISNEIRDIEGVEVAIFIRETEKGFKASLRSNKYVNVGKVCEKYGGGGHNKSAGVTIEDSIENVKRKIIETVMEQL